MMGEIIDIAKVSKINQITIPKAVREILKLNPDDRLVFKREDNKIVIEKA
ncbi:looped-hinge helix DNA binding domain, AbrB family [Candidatus Methanoperedens nitroreducens]|uniref:Looped-hinge helix DNA binding domain, AbrB family n=1 Tax=Candidatus Methanoperedens nitratireducens TaxID=1392998 RepID=A0A062V9B4_9EURY|nr:AbrB/MazE/SpoVT family DNA-binding domain-containing protein [Candidatus Methanoperedens nitroreducens]KCZ72349.1 looped-hinge helix DNA binding domain, AbrB family [Candidatus Methanoperedens nitroreducens]MDJ1423717.1 AbrB/MazE/SpoVT family DNA-binding domain-containing protein [Candidatus Methanoperedens sp.]